jgi:hypothetical protein
MKKSLIVLAIISLSGCGSFKQVLDSNEKRKTEHVKFQVNRLNAISTCYQNAATDALKHGCQLLQSQLQTEQGFTVQAGLDGLPETPENQIKSGVLDTVKLGVGYKLGEKLIDGLNRPNDVITVKEPYEVKVPQVITVTPAASIGVVE